MMPTGCRTRLTEVNPCIMCVLCSGYLIDATTIVECLHSFCRSCIIRYLESNSFCPICDVQIHKVKPFRNIKSDKALQSIIYKLVPGLYHAEMARRRKFYSKHPDEAQRTSPEDRGMGLERMIYAPSDKISLSLEYADSSCELDDCESGSASSHSSMFGEHAGLKKRFLLCPAVVTVGNLKKFLRYKYELAPAHKVDVFHKRERLSDDLTLMDVAYIYTWKRNGPMEFLFRFYELGQQTTLAYKPVEPRDTVLDLQTPSNTSYHETPEHVPTSTEHQEDCSQVCQMVEAFDTSSPLECQELIAVKDPVSSSVVQDSESSYEPPLETLAEVPAELPVKSPAELPIKSPAELPVKSSAELTADLPAASPVVSPTELPAVPVVSASDETLNTPITEVPNAIENRPTPELTDADSTICAAEEPVVKIGEQVETVSGSPKNSVPECDSTISRIELPESPTKQYGDSPRDQPACRESKSEESTRTTESDSLPIGSNYNGVEAVTHLGYPEKEPSSVVSKQTTSSEHKIEVEPSVTKSDIFRSNKDLSAIESRSVSSPSNSCVSSGLEMNPRYPELDQGKPSRISIGLLASLALERRNSSALSVTASKRRRLGDESSKCEKKAKITPKLVPHLVNINPYAVIPKNTFNKQSCGQETSNTKQCLSNSVENGLQEDDALRSSGNITIKPVTVQNTEQIVTRKIEEPKPAVELQVKSPSIPAMIGQLERPQRPVSHMPILQTPPAPSSPPKPFCDPYSAKNGSIPCLINIKSVNSTKVNPKKNRLSSKRLTKRVESQKHDRLGALDLSATTRRSQHTTDILAIAQNLARRQQQMLGHASTPAPPLSPLSSLSAFPVPNFVPVRSPPPPLRIPVPPTSNSNYRLQHPHQQRPSSLSSSSPSPPAENGLTNARSPRVGTSPHEMFSNAAHSVHQGHHLPPPPPPSPSSNLMFRSRFELQNPWHGEWYNNQLMRRCLESLRRGESLPSAPYFAYPNGSCPSSNKPNIRK